uniref:Protein kinase domain-containing protein n=1 Tax=Plectus sambesii TaxID=2011161 RepID=A0A914W3S4_9BILA
MGAAESAMKDLQVGEALPATSGVYRIWTDVHPCVYRGQRKATVFIRSFADTDSEETRKFFENGIQTLRQLRHPCVVDYCSSSMTKSELCLITERAQPLDLAVEGLQSVEIHCGLKNILDSLIFLQDCADRCHNNVCPSSIFVTSDGRWKLGSFECAQKLENSKHWVQTAFVKTVKEAAYVPPEDEEMMNNDTPAHARDSYGFGKLIEYLLPFMNDDLTEETKEELNLVMTSLTSRTASLRPQLGAFASSVAFKNELTDMIDTLRSIHVKSAEEKKEFFGSVVGRLRSLPPLVVARRLAQLLLSRYVLLEPEAATHLLPVLLQPKGDDEDETSGGLLPMGLFQRYIAPELSKIFCVHECAVRLALLAEFPRYVNALSTSVLEEDILPELLLGMKDLNEGIVAASLRCLADLVPFLGAAAVTGLPHKKYFADGKPKTYEPGKQSSTTMQGSDVIAFDAERNAIDQIAKEERKRQQKEKMEERRRAMEAKRAERPAESKSTRKMSDMTVAAEADAVSFPNAQLALAEDAEDAEVEVGVEVEALADADTEDAPDWTDWEESSSAVADQTATLFPAAPAISIPSHAASLSTTQNNAIQSAERTKSTEVAPLGAEFDVMALKVKKREQSVDEAELMDFFADMTPTFADKSKKAESEEKAPAKEEPAGRSSLFGVSDQGVAEVDAGGGAWGDDGWDND